MIKIMMQEMVETIDRAINIVESEKRTLDIAIDKITDLQEWLEWNSLYVGKDASEMIEEMLKEWIGGELSELILKIRDDKNQIARLEESEESEESEEYIDILYEYEDIKDVSYNEVFEASDLISYLNEFKEKLEKLL